MEVTSEDEVRNWERDTVTRDIIKNEVGSIPWL
jgi:hypothetical protein